MKKALILILCLSFITCGCARYRATALNHLPPEIVSTSPNQGGVTVAAKAFTKADCKSYLDRDVLCKGYQPVQLYIENTSPRPYFFSTSRVSLPTASPEEVAFKVHTSTVGRIVGYSVAAAAVCPLFVIPAVVDGIGSARANETLDNDFIAKAAKDLTILPYSHINMLIFVPSLYYQNTFAVTLIDEWTNQPLQIITTAR